MKKTIIVIGGGACALYAANLLVQKGHKVILLEKNEEAGWLSDLNERFAAESTNLFFDYQKIDDLFTQVGKKHADDLKVQTKTIFYRVFSGNGNYFDFSNDESKLLEQIERWNPNDVKTFPKFLKECEAIYLKGIHPFENDSRSRKNGLIKSLSGFFSSDSHKTMTQLAESYFENTFLRKCFSFHPLYFGLNPDETSSFYSHIFFQQQKKGLCAVSGGWKSLFLALKQLFTEQGGTVHFNAEVQEILVDKKQIVGVLLADGQVMECDTVVSGLDFAYTLSELVDEQHRYQYSDADFEKETFSDSYFTLRIDSSKTYHNHAFETHNLIFDNLLDKYFGGLSKKPCLLLTLLPPDISKQNIDEGMSFFVQLPVSNLSEYRDWELISEELKYRIVQFLEAKYLPELSKYITRKTVVNPEEYQRNFGYYEGSVFSIKPDSTHSGRRRAPVKSEDISGLYFIGQGVQPGIGLNGSLISAKMVETLIGNAG